MFIAREYCVYPLRFEGINVEDFVKPYKSSQVISNKDLIAKGTIYIIVSSIQGGYLLLALAMNVTVHFC